MKIRNYQKEDFAELCVLMNEFNDYIVSVDTERIVKSFSSQSDLELYTTQTIKDAYKRNGFIYLAEENGDVIGFIQGIIDNNDKDLLYKLSHISFSDGWIGELFVKTEYRGRGTGKKLVNEAYKYFRKHGCRFVRLLVLNDNSETVKIYKNLGFKVRDLELTNEL